ncbi:MAG: MOSC N-terminal beta barrel domain-containing protein [Rhodospirillaceae bacterium]|nr:MOSC N-terminal beta barrel domain-containing protein [Rhodospirillales bacterium]
MPTPMDMASLARILRFPVKSLSAEDLERITLVAGHGLPGDRRFALARAETSPPTEPRWLPNDQLLTLSRFPRLAQLDTRLDGERLTIRRRGRVVLSTDVGTVHGRSVVSAFFAAFLAGECFGHPRLVEFADGFGDTPLPRLSLMGAATLDEVERAGGRRLDPAELRANLVLKDLAPRSEQHWIGRRLHLGNAVLAVTNAVERVILPELHGSTFGHGHLGVWAEVVTGGDIRLGDEASTILTSDIGSTDNHLPTTMDSQQRRSNAGNLV